jgi:polyhydroxybutyrate depolymerase
VVRVTYRDCQSDVALYRVEGGGHTWPGSGQQTARPIIVGRTSRDIDATDEIWRFFSHR